MAQHDGGGASEQKKTRTQEGFNDDDVNVDDDDW